MNDNFIKHGQVRSCYGCSERKVGCHAVCEKYKAAKAKAEEINRRVDKERRLDSACEQIASKNSDRYGDNK